LECYHVKIKNWKKKKKILLGSFDHLLRLSEHKQERFPHMKPISKNNNNNNNNK